MLMSIRKYVIRGEEGEVSRPDLPTNDLCRMMIEVVRE